MLLPRGNLVEVAVDVNPWFLFETNSRVKDPVWISGGRDSRCDTRLEGEILYKIGVKQLRLEVSIGAVPAREPIF